VIERLLTQLRNCELQPGNKKDIKIYLNSKGGRALDGIKLGRLFRKYNIEASVGSGQLCASACAFAFLGAKSRYISNDAELLFHAPFKKKLFGISCDSRVDSQWLKDYFVEMLSDHQGEQLFDKTMSACGVNAGWVANINYINTLE
jgi:ATP-dependent protease ClpP protease subunit